MIPAYIFIAFLFFKIMPPFMFDFSNSLTGAFMMALVSAFPVFIAIFFLSYRGEIAIAKASKDPGAAWFFWTGIVIFSAGTAAAAGACYLVGIGFASQFMDHIFEPYRGRDREDDPFWFFVMCAIPAGSALLVTLGNLVFEENRVRDAAELERKRK